MYSGADPEILIRGANRGAEGASPKLRAAFLLNLNRYADAQNSIAALHTINSSTSSSPVDQKLEQVTKLGRAGASIKKFASGLK